MGSCRKRIGNGVSGKLTPFHRDGDCEVMSRSGALCKNHALSKVTRRDGTTYPICLWCSKKLAKQIEKYPNVFEAVTITHN